MRVRCVCVEHMSVCVEGGGMGSQARQPVVVNYLKCSTFLFTEARAGGATAAALVAGQQQCKLLQVKPSHAIAQYCCLVG